jgi:DNA-binding CsgD family transcriptional regulator
MVQSKTLSESLTTDMEARTSERTRELEKNNEELRKEIAERERCELELRQAKERAESVLASVADIHMLFDKDWRCLYANKAAVEAFGFSADQVMKQTLWELFPAITGTDLERHYRLAMDRRLPLCLEYYHPVTGRWWRTRFLPAEEGLAVFATNVTEQKKAMDALRQREKELEAKSSQFEEANTALKVLLKHRDEDKATIEKTIVKNIEESVFPYMERLRNTRLDDKQTEYLNVIHTNLQNVVSPFLQKVSAGFTRFTPMETEVAHLIRSGKTSKEIAALLSLSKRTIDTHRDGIRRKMGLLNKKTNLQVYLTSFNNT